MVVKFILMVKTFLKEISISTPFPETEIIFTISLEVSLIASDVNSWAPRILNIYVVLTNQDGMNRWRKGIYRKRIEFEKLLK